MLAIVEHEQQPARRRFPDDRIHEGDIRLFTHCEDLRHDPRHKPGLTDVRQFDEPDAVRVRGLSLRRHFEREARFADAARADQGEETGRGEETPDFRNVVLTANKRCEFSREVIRRRIDRAERRKILHEERVHDLKDPLGVRDIAQPDYAEIAQRDVRGQPPPRELGDCMRDEHLAAARGIHDPSRPVDGGSEKVAVAGRGNARVQATADANGHLRVLLHLGERLLQGDGRANRVDRVVERRMRAIARHLDDGSAMISHRGTRQCIVALQCLRHPLRRAFPKAAAAFDVGEKEGDDPGREIHARTVPRPVATGNGSPTTG